MQLPGRRPTPIVAGSQLHSRCPGRICLGGEHLDWLSGHSLLSAVSLRLTATVRAAPRQGEPRLTATSAQYPGTRLEVTPGNLGRYDGGCLDYLHAAVVVLMRRTGVPLPSADLFIDSGIPTSAGLSSSAAVTLASLGVLAGFFRLRLSHAELCQMAYEAEAGELKTGAGEMDFHICASGGTIYLDCSQMPPRSVAMSRFPAGTAVVIADSLARHSTKATIADIRSRLVRRDSRTLLYFEMTSRAVGEMFDLMVRDPANVRGLGRLIFECHMYISAYLGVSTPKIDACVQASMDHGAYGAKLTGAGHGGSMFALVHRSRVADVVVALRQLQVGIFVTEIDNVGIV